MPKKIEKDELREGLGFYARDIVTRGGKPLLIEIAMDNQNNPWLSIDTNPGVWYSFEEEIDLPGKKKMTAINLMIDQYEPDPPFGYILPMARWYMMKSGKTAPWMKD